MKSNMVIYIATFTRKSGWISIKRTKIEPGWRIWVFDDDAFLVLVDYEIFSARGISITQSGTSTKTFKRVIKNFKSIR